MNAKENGALESLLFGSDGAGVADFKCFRGDRDDVSEDDLRDQIHSALMQKRMKRASISKDAPRKAPIVSQNIREFVKGLAEPA
ncbi:MAG: hypothetical protein ABL957_03825 [Parvularculaceae bacterium]